MGFGYKINTAFVVMQYLGQDKVYDAIAEGCTDAGVSARRADKTAGSGLVLKKIFKNIVEAEFIVCDLTNERPNVYYELGFAMGVGNLPNDILLITSDISALHFDLKGLDVKEYKDMSDLRDIVAKSMREMVKLRVGVLRRMSVQLVRKLAQRVVHI
jgi:hypothetical protein